MAIFPSTCDKSRRLAQSTSPIPLRIAWSPDVAPGTLVASMSTFGSAMVIECGNHESAQGLTVAMEHIECLLESIDALSPRSESFKKTVTYNGNMRTYSLHTRIQPERGFEWTRPVFSELLLRDGETYARSQSGLHCAPRECYILMPSKFPAETDFDAGYLALKQ